MQTYNVAIYARLSKEDSTIEQSRSIESQIIALTNYSKEKKFNIYNTYIDDGVSGATLDRPSFNKLISDMKLKKFNTIIIKDLSRLGRNLIEVGNLLEVVLPQNNIRLISVNENYDSLTYVDDESILLRTFLNDYYLKECKKKSNNAINQRAKSKSLSVRGAYGYMWDENKNIIINPNAALTVKLIFNMFLDNKTPTQIANYLMETNTLSPAATRYQLYNQTCNKIDIDNCYYWSRTSIDKILSNYQYTGNTVNLKQKKQNGKYVKNYEPIILTNTHEAIISEEMYDKVQAIRNKKTITKPDNLDQYRIKGMFKCSCGKSLIYEHKYKSKIYRCKGCRISYKTEDIHQVLIQDIKQLIIEYASNSKTYEKKLKNLLINSDDSNSLIELQKEKNHIENKISNLYESYYDNKINKEEYLLKIKELKQYLELINNDINKYDNFNLDLSLFDIRLKELKKDINNSLNLNDLDLIRNFISKCIIYNEDRIRLKVEYKCGIRIS